jgi:hypothetical protein
MEKEDSFFPIRGRKTFEMAERMGPVIAHRGTVPAHSLSYDPGDAYVKQDLNPYPQGIAS